MRTFEYSAVDAAGVLVAARAQATSELELDRDLEARGQTLIHASEVKKGSRCARRKLKHQELIAFTTQLATVTSAGVPLVEGLASIGQRLETPGSRALVAEMVEGLRAGDSLSQVMERYPGAFPEVYRSSVVAGESSGSLDQVLVRLARFLEWSRGMKATATQALIYPAILMSAVFGLILVLLYYVLPKILKLFPGGKDDLPTETRIVLGASDFLRENIVVLLIAGALFVAGAISFLRTRRGRETKDRALLGVPKLGRVLRQLATSRWASTASILHAAGCDVFTVLNTASAACGNAAMEAAFARSTERVRGGATITEAIEKEEGLDPLLMQMIGVGERSGELDKCLNSLVGFYDEEVPRSVKKFLSLLEPCMLIFAGVVVAFILLAALMPIFNLYENMH